MDRFAIAVMALMIVVGHFSNVQRFGRLERKVDNFIKSQQHQEVNVRLYKRIPNTNTNSSPILEDFLKDMFLRKYKDRLRQMLEENKREEKEINLDEAPIEKFEGYMDECELYETLT